MPASLGRNDEDYGIDDSLIGDIQRARISGAMHSVRRSAFCTPVIFPAPHHYGGWTNR